MPHIKLLRFSALLLLSLLCSSVAADDFEVDLNGFRLQQFVKVPEASLGPSFKTMEWNELVLDAYALGPDAYMVVGHTKKYPNNIATLQLTGETSAALPFKGLVLGDSKSKVIQVLGSPDRVEEIAEPKVTKLAYTGRNYTVELDDQGRLYSIQIFATADLMTKADGIGTEWSDFKASVLSKNFPAVASMLRPDVEIYKSGETLSINTRFSDFLKSPDKSFVAALIGDRDSVLEEIARTEPVQELRLILNFGVGTVYKFPTGKVLKEIVFFPFNGRYRVYEIAFRERAK